MYPMQKGYVTKTFADITELTKDYKYFPITDIKFGIKNFENWFMNYNKNE